MATKQGEYERRVQDAIDALFRAQGKAMDARLRNGRVAGDTHEFLQEAADLARHAAAILSKAKAGLEL